MKMSQRLHFWHHNLLKITIFCKNGKKKKKIWSKNFKQPTKCNFELKMLNLLENYLKTNV